jgi:hypothetical protein
MLANASACRSHDFAFAEMSSEALSALCRTYNHSKSAHPAVLAETPKIAFTREEN